MERRGGIFGRRRSFLLCAYCFLLRTCRDRGKGEGISASLPPLLPTADFLFGGNKKSFPDFLLPLILTQVVEKGKASYCVFFWGGERKACKLEGNQNGSAKGERTRGEGERKQNKKAQRLMT